MRGLGGGSGNLNSPRSLHAWMSQPDDPPMLEHHWGAERFLGKGYFPLSRGCGALHQLVHFPSFRAAVRVVIWGQ